MKQAFLSNWKFGEVLYVDEDKLSSVVLDEEGFYYRVCRKGEWVAQKLRIIDLEPTAPIFTNESELVVMD
eukprot:TRINITY_DN1006_c3_g1_i1.p2 TRINITY_DN1006_c3_g1~~TRINITY_DN1006_c3_g1_i1.p2  ORF type:complete len:70 (-),score=16.79 TRINITY_DN1006_c3_g1_i1:132-341(-)